MIDNYLIVGPSWVGDMVMAQSLFMLLKQRQPEANIDVLAPGWSLPILARMPEVRQGIELPFAHGELAFAARRQLGRSLKSAGYSKAIVLPRSFKSALVPFFAGIPQRIGFSGELRSMLLTDARKRRKTRDGQTITDKTVWRYLGLGVDREEYRRYQFEVPTPRLNLAADLDAVLQRLDLNTERPAVCICPGAEYGPAKQWPLEAHRQVAEALAEQGYQVWILGGPKDAEAAATIAAGVSPFIYNLCGKTKLTDVIDLSALAQVVISHDSGLMHVAAAAGAKVIAIYGSSSPDFTPPLTELATIFAPSGLACAPCFERTCRFGHYQCMQQTGVEQVLAAVKQAAV